MRLAEYTDHTLRVLMHCAANPGRLITIAEVAQAQEISKNNLMKIVSDLARQGVLETIRGRSGGVRLVKPPSEIRIGDVVRGAETDFRLVECFDPRTNGCTLTPSCRLKHLFDEALQAGRAGVARYAGVDHLEGEPGGVDLKTRPFEAVRPETFESLSGSSP